MTEPGDAETNMRTTDDLASAVADGTAG